MDTTLELVYTYRRLMSRVDAGAGLELDDIMTVIDIEQRFAAVGAGGDSGAGGERVELRATLRNDKLGDEVAVVELGPGGCVCREAPYADDGDCVELVIDMPEASLSYRFKARVAWLRDDGDDFALGLAFVGAPVLLHYGSARPSSPRLLMPIAA